MEQIVNYQERPLRLVTRFGIVEGVLRTSPMLRVLDDINVMSRNFITLHSPVTYTEDWPDDGGPLAVNRSSVLFVVELEPPPPRPGGPMAGELTRFTRAPLRLRVGEFTIEGFVHVPPGGNAMSRLYQDSRPFLAVTSARIQGPSVEDEIGFVAVHRSHVLAAQVLAAPATPDAASEREGESVPVEEGAAETPAEAES